MASYLLQEPGDRITLEDASGFLLLEESTDDTPALGVHRASPLQITRVFEDEDAIAAVLTLL